MYEFYIECSGEDSKDVKQLLEQNDTKFRFNTYKSSDIPTIIYVTAATLAIIDILKKWILELKSRKMKIFTKSGKQFNLRTSKKEKICNAISSESDPKKRHQHSKNN